MKFRRATAYGLYEGRIDLMYQLVRPKAKIGKVYAIEPTSNKRGARPERSIGRVRIEHIRVLELGEVDEERAQRAGYRTLALFQQMWRERYGWWDPDRVVWEIEVDVIQREAQAAVA